MALARRKTTAKSQKIEITPATASEIIASLGITPAEMRHARRAVAEAERSLSKRARPRRSSLRVDAKPRKKAKSKN